MLTTKIDTIVPLTVVRGHIEELTLSIPWMSLGRENISVKAKNCFALLKVDIANLHEFERGQYEMQGKKVLGTMERKIVDTFKQIQNKKSNYLKYLIMGLLRSLQVGIDNLRIRVELVDLADVVGGFELVFSQLKYDNNIQHMVQCRFEGEVETNGLDIVDLRIKSIKGNRLILNEYSVKELREMTTPRFVAFFQNEAHPSYLLCPFLFQIRFTKIYTDEKKDKCHKQEIFDFSPIEVNLSNEDVQVINAILMIVSCVQEYSVSKRLSPSVKLKNQESREIYDQLRLNRAISKARAEASLRNIQNLKSIVSKFKEKKDMYEFCYEIKVLHLMENEFEKTTERLYDSLMSVTSPQGTEHSIEDLILRCEEIEKNTHYLLIIFFRDNVMVKIRNQAYFKGKLVERKKKMNEIKEKNNGMIAGILRKGISRIWRAKEVVHLDDILGEEQISQEDKALKESIIKFDTILVFTVEIKCIQVKCQLKRYGKNLLEVNLLGIKFKHSENYEGFSSRTTLKLSGLKISDEGDVAYIQILREKGSQPDLQEYLKPRIESEAMTMLETQSSTLNQSSNYSIELIIDSNISLDSDKDDVKLIPQTIEIKVEHIMLNILKDCVSKLVYFSMDFSESLNFSISNLSSNKYPLRKNSSFSQVLSKITRLDEKVQSIKIEVKSVMCVFRNFSNGDFLGFRFVPSLVLKKYEVSIQLKEFELFYSNGFLDFELAALNPSILESCSKVIKKTTISFLLVRRTSDRLSLDIKATHIEIFLTTGLLLLLDNLLRNFTSMNILSKDFMMSSLKKDPKITKKKKNFGLNKLSSQFPSNLGLLQTLRSSRKGSNHTFMTAGSQLFEEEFFDAFEDETDLFAHNELKNRLELVENAAMLLSPQLDIIQENEQTKYQQRKFEIVKMVELSSDIKIEELSLVVYSNNDPKNYIQACFSQVNLFYDSNDLSIKLNEITFFLKQNLMTLIMKDMWIPLCNIIEQVNSSLDKLLGREKAQKPDEIVEKENKDSENIFQYMKSIILEANNSFNIEIRVQNTINIYFTEQIDRTISPGIYISLLPVITFDQKAIKLKSTIKLDVFNKEIGFYEPFIEEIQIEASVGSDTSQLKVDFLIPTFLVNIKPSILKHLLDYVSVYSSQKVKLSAERNSVITIKNDAGVQIFYMVNANGMKKVLKPNDSVEVNLFVVPKNPENEDSHLESVDLSVDQLSYIENKKATLKLIGRFGDDGSGNTQLFSRETTSTSFFSKKKIQLEIPTFEETFIIDLSNMTDTYKHIGGNLFLVGKLEVDNYQSFLTLRSNYALSNTLDFDIECAVYLQRCAISKDEQQFDIFKKRRKKSDVLSEGDNLSKADSFDLTFNDPPKSNRNSSSENHGLEFSLRAHKPNADQEFRNTLLMKFIIKSKAKKFLPLLRNFPKNYYLVCWPAHQDFFEGISEDSSQEMINIKQQNMMQNRVYFEEIFKKDCGISSIVLLHSVVYL